MVGSIDALLQGVLLGGLYALFAAGLALIFGVMRLVNLAHGDLIVLAAFAILTLATWLGLGPFAAAVAALPRIKQEGTSVVLVEQDIAQAMKVAQRVYCFQEGWLSLAGNPAGLSREAIHAAYFGA